MSICELLLLRKLGTCVLRMGSTLRISSTTTGSNAVVVSDVRGVVRVGEVAVSSIPGPLLSSLQESLVGVAGSCDCVDVVAVFVVVVDTVLGTSAPSSSGTTTGIPLCRAIS